MALLAHLRQGSLRVGVGDRVEAGQLIGEVGHSGNSVVPHLHFQIMNGRDPVTAAIVPFRVKRYEGWDGRCWRLIEHSGLEKRQRLRFAAKHQALQAGGFA